MMEPGKTRGLRDVIRNPLCAGIWTWSRGGRWERPYIKNALWCELNTYVIVEQAWRILFIGSDAANPGQFVRRSLEDAIQQYDALWMEWRELESSKPECATLHIDTGFEGLPGLGVAIARQRALLK